MLGVFATALFYGDSMITPAISVLSAVEGLTTVNAGLEPFVIPIAIGILVGLFAIQSRGTARVGLMFGPVMIFYFVTLAVLGVMHIMNYPAVITAMFNPMNAVHFFTADFMRAFVAHGLGRPGGHRRRGALCRHGAFRAQADPHFVDLFRPAGAAAQLYGAGGDDPVGRPGDGARQGQGPVLLSRSRHAAAAAGAARHRRDDHRQPGGDLGRLLGHPAGDPARLRPAPPDHPHQRERGRARSTFRSSTGR